MKSPRRALIGSYIAFGIAAALVAAGIIVGIVNAQQGIEQATQNDALTPAPVKVDTQRKPTPKAQQSVENKPAEPSMQATTPSQSGSLQQAPQAKKQQGGHIPFTQKEVTPGDPESYVDTVGQCPFYEMGGPKGCVPPPDIECNADWTECHPKEL